MMIWLKEINQTEIRCFILDYSCLFRLNVFTDNYLYKTEHVIKIFIKSNVIIEMC